MKKINHNATKLIAEVRRETTSREGLQELAQDGNRIVRATAKESLEKLYDNN